MTSHLPPPMADALMLGTVNASLPGEIDADSLAAAIREDLPARPWRAHLIALFTEVSLNGLDCFLRGRHIPAGQALACYRTWVAPTDPKPAVEQWLVERRDLEKSAA